MKPFRSGVLVSWCLVLFMATLAGCNSGNKTAQTSASLPSPTSNRVVLYCSVDEVYAKPIIKKLEAQAGLRIDALFDTEAAKTAGLANRIRAERDRPRGDVFWNSALLQTLLLAREGLLQPYQSPSARDIPKQFKDPRGAWTALGTRERLIVCHATVPDAPRSLQDLISPRFKNKVGISNPQFGSAADWVAALATRWGVAKTLNYFRALKKNGVRVLPGNSVVADKVARGELIVGVTDSDDALAQIGKDPMRFYIADTRRQPQLDAVVVPGSVAMLKGAPHAQAARRLVDALLKVETETQLAFAMRGVTPLRGEFPTMRTAKPTLKVNPATDPRIRAPDDTARWPAAWDKVREPLAEILLGE